MSNLIGISVRHPIADQLVLGARLAGIALAIVFIDLVNCPRMKAYYGSAVANRACCAA